MRHCDGIEPVLPALGTVVAVVWAVVLFTLLCTVALFKLGLAKHPYVQDIALWGKNKKWRVKDGNVSPWLRFVNVPKAWFCHFYLLGVSWHAVLLLACLATYMGTGVYPLRTDFLCLFDTVSTSNISCDSCLLALLLLVIQTGRRLWESIYMTAPSDAQMHATQYIVGLAFYIGTGLAVVSDSPFGAHGSGVSIWHIVGVILFAWGTWHQYRCHEILYRLRMSPHTTKATPRYAIPYGDWFEYVSSPHYLAEMIIYIGIGVTMRLANISWMLIIGFVIGNLGWGAVHTHEWYRQKFDDYPTHRKAVVPFVY